MSGHIDIDWSRKDRSYFLSAKADVDAKSGAIQMQIADAKREFASGGAASDLGWLRRAEGAVFACSRISQQIQIRLRTLKEEEKAINIAAAENAQKKFGGLLRELVVAIKQVSIGEEGAPSRYEAALAAAQAGLAKSSMEAEA